MVNTIKSGKNKSEKDKSSSNSSNASFDYKNEK